jgi:hypothetical protein
MVSHLFLCIVIIIIIKYYENFYATRKDIKLEKSNAIVIHNLSCLELDYKMTIKGEFKGERHRQK